MTGHVPPKTARRGVLETKRKQKTGGALGVRLMTRRSDVVLPTTASRAAELSALCRRIYPRFFTDLWTDDAEWYMSALTPW